MTDVVLISQDISASLAGVSWVRLLSQVVVVVIVVLRFQSQVLLLWGLLVSLESCWLRSATYDLPWGLCASELILAVCSLVIVKFISCSSSFSVVNLLIIFNYVLVSLEHAFSVVHVVISILLFNSLSCVRNSVSVLLSCTLDSVVLRNVRSRPSSLNNLVLVIHKVVEISLAVNQSGGKALTLISEQVGSAHSHCCVCVSSWSYSWLLVQLSSWILESGSLSGGVHWLNVELCLHHSFLLFHLLCLNSSVVQSHLPLLVLHLIRLRVFKGTLNILELVIKQRILLFQHFLLIFDLLELCQLIIQIVNLPLQLVVVKL